MEKKKSYGGRIAVGTTEKIKYYGVWPWPREKIKSKGGSITVGTSAACPAEGAASRAKFDVRTPRRGWLWRGNICM